MFTVPAATPVTKPVDEFIVALPVPSELLHVPPDVASESKVVPPTHALKVPVIGEIELNETVVVLEEKQPSASVIVKV